MISNSDFTKRSWLWRAAIGVIGGDAIGDILKALFGGCESEWPIKALVFRCWVCYWVHLLGSLLAAILAVDELSVTNMQSGALTSSSPAAQDYCLQARRSDRNGVRLPFSIIAGFTMKLNRTAIWLQVMGLLIWTSNWTMVQFGFWHSEGEKTLGHFAIGIVIFVIAYGPLFLSCLGLVRYFATRK